MKEHSHCALLAHRAAGNEPAFLADGSPAPLPRDRDLDSGVVRRVEPATGASLIVSAPSIDAGTIARFAEFDRAMQARDGLDEVD